MTLAIRHRLRRRESSFSLPRSGGYLTDGRRLYRVVSQFAFAGDRVLASLEDCLTLDVRAYAPSELYELRLRPVRSGAATLEQGERA
jgi:hypothetical protein